MHKLFKTLLSTAFGESKFVIAINIDVREFSSFSKKVDSAESALFVLKVFSKLINGYFDDASYLKSTGDGLIIIYDITEVDLIETSTKVLDASLKIIKEFQSLCDKEPMINFDVPKKCGIGITRGPATCIRTEDKILDYFGDALNLASRLMDCSRPEGITFDSKFGFDILPDELKEQFEEKMIFLKGINEQEPIKIYYTKDCTIISESFEKPINAIKWEKKTWSTTIKQMKLINATYQYRLEDKPSNKAQFKVSMRYPLIKNGAAVRGLLTNREINAYEYITLADKHIIDIHVPKLLAILNKLKLKNDTKIEIDIYYTVNV